MYMQTMDSTPFKYRIQVACMTMRSQAYLTRLPKPAASALRPPKKICKFVHMLLNMFQIINPKNIVKLIHFLLERLQVYAAKFMLLAC